MEMTRRSQDLIELIKRKASMSTQIVTKVDSDYALYVGANYEIGKKMAMIDTMLKHGLIDGRLIPFVKLYRSYLDQQRKAYFSNLCTEITKLGFLLGDQRSVKKATSLTSE